MWASITFALAGAGFMSCFLAAVWRDYTRESASRVVLHRCGPAVRVSSALRNPSGRNKQYYDRGRADEFEDGDCVVAVSESEIHAKNSSGLITVAILPRVGISGWRAKSWLKLHDHHRRIS